MLTLMDWQDEVVAHSIPGPARDQAMQLLQQSRASLVPFLHQLMRAAGSSSSGRGPQLKLQASPASCRELATMISHIS